MELKIQKIKYSRKYLKKHIKLISLLIRLGFMFSAIMIIMVMLKVKSITQLNRIDGSKEKFLAELFLFNQF